MIEHLTTEVKAPEINKIEKNGHEKKDYKSHAKSIRGILQGLVIKFSKEAKENKTYSAYELQKLFEEVLRKFNEMYPNNITKVEIIEGWEKSDGYFPIEKNFENNFVVEIWHNEQKERKEVKKEDLNRMLNVIRKLEIGRQYKCYAIAKLMGVNWKYIWKERMNVYFPRYYIPLKVLDRLGIIKYGGNKKIITRLK